MRSTPHSERRSIMKSATVCPIIHSLRSGGSGGGVTLARAQDSRHGGTRIAARGSLTYRQLRRDAPRSRGGKGEAARRAAGDRRTVAARRYDDDEVSEILARATGGRGGVGEHPGREGLTLEELQAIGEDVGIEADRVAEAAGSHGRR